MLMLLGGPFAFVSSRAVGAAMTAFILMLVVMPPLIAWLKRKKFGESGAKNQGAAVVDEARERKKGTPTMGGLGIVAVTVLTALLWCDPTSYRVMLLLFCLLGFATLGFLDDRTKIFVGSKGTPLFVKLGVQIGTALVCGLGLWWIDGHYATILNPTGAEAYTKTIQGVEYTVHLGTHAVTLPFTALEHALHLGLFTVLWSLFVTIACANGVNFTDGMDGLAAGTMVIAALGFCVIAYLTARVDAAQYLGTFFVPGGEEVAVFLAAVAGACLGFLWFNGAPAEIFMGDTGSQALGGTLGLAALMTKQEFLILLIGIIFVVEAGSVALQILSYRCFNKRRIFLCAPIHHHFQMKGWPESKIVVRFWMVAALAALFAVVTLKIR